MFSQTRRSFLRSAAAGALAMRLTPRAESLLAPESGRPAGSRCGYVADRRYEEHKIFKDHPESPSRLVAIHKAVSDTGLINELHPIAPATDPLDAIARIHTPKHIAAVSSLPVTGEIARLAVAGTLSAVDAVCSGSVRNAFCALRPPGHHAANSGREEGFCYFNNIAIAARHAQITFALHRILIIDWDYHHGNGTERTFYDDATVLFFSTHDHGAYPGTGDPARRGNGEGEGFTINVHCGRGTTDATMYRIWEETLLPAADRFRPNLVLISAGFDSRKNDPLGCHALTDEGFARLTRMAMQIADTHCDGRLVSLLEGGYNIAGLASAVVAHLGALVGS